VTCLDEFCTLDDRTINSRLPLDIYESKFKRCFSSYLRMRGKRICVHVACFSLFTEIPKISNTQATAGSDEAGGGAGGGRGK
jgi:hypothetical protein